MLWPASLPGLLRREGGVLYGMYEGVGVKMKLLNAQTGDVLEVPPPDSLGISVVRFNGRVVERVLYSDVTGSATTEDGRTFTPSEWSAYIVQRINSDSWGVKNEH